MNDDKPEFVCPSDDGWLVRLVPYLPQMGAIPLLVSSDTFTRAETTVIIGRVHIIRSISATGSEYHDEQPHKAELSTSHHKECEKWKKHGVRYLNKNMLQFSFHSCEEASDTDTAWKSMRCYVNTCGKNVLPTIFLNGKIFSELSKDANGAIELHNHDELRFVVPCLEEFLEASYRLVYRCLPAQAQPSGHSPGNSSEEDDKSSILSLYHFSHSYEQHSCSLYSPTGSTSATHGHSRQFTETVLLSSLSNHQLQQLRDEYQLIVSNESLRVAAPEEQHEKQIFLQAILSLTVENNRSNFTTGNERKSNTTTGLPHLLSKITLDESLSPFLAG